LLGDEEVRVTLGLGEVPAGVDASALLVDHVLIFRDSELANKVGTFVVNLLCRRMMTDAWYSEGLPGRLAAIMNEAVAPTYLAKLKCDWEIWLKVCTKPGAFWKKAVKRSPFGLLFVQQVIQVAIEGNWMVTGKLVKVVSEAFQGFGQTKIVEDGWNKERHAEVQGNKNKRMKKSRMWMTLVESQVLGKVHRFDEVPYRDEPLDFGLKDMNIDALFQPTLKGVSLDVSGLVSKQQTPPWYSPAPLSYLGHVADLSLYRFCEEHKCYAVAGDSWLTILVNGTNLCLKHKKIHNVFYFAHANYSGVAAVGWPAVEAHGRGGKVYYRPSATAKPEDTAMLHIMDLDSWDAFTYKWIGPLQLAKQFNVDDGVLSVVPDHPPENFFKCCARQAFFKLPKTPLQQLARYKGLDTDPSHTLLELVEMLVLKAFPKMTDTELLSILRLRVHVKDAMCDVLDSIDLVQLGSKDDEKQMALVQKDMQDEEVQVKEFTEEFKQFEQKAIAKNKNTKKVPLKVGPTGKPYPKKLPDFQDFALWSDVQTITDLLPPDDSKVFKDIVGHRFQLFWTVSRKTRSSAWLRYGYGGAVQRTLKLAWEEWERLGTGPASFNL
jgi:hypothetical protein